MLTGISYSPALDSIQRDSVKVSPGRQMPLHNTYIPPCGSSKERGLLKSQPWHPAEDHALHPSLVLRADDQIPFDSFSWIQIDLDPLRLCSQPHLVV